LEENFLDSETPLACDRLALTPEIGKRHFEELGPTLTAIKKRVRELPNGFEFEFPSDPATAELVSEWAAGERRCCPFFDIEWQQEPDEGAGRLRLTGGEGIKEFIRSEFAGWFRG
jgi:hypothetical protein